MKLAGLILAAGLSSRMGDFKPLLNLGGYTLISRTITAMVNSGVEDVCVVLGKNAVILEQHLREFAQEYSLPFNLVTVRNEAYAETDMLTSIKIGLQTLQSFDGVFILPGDMPAINPRTFRLLGESLAAGEEPVVFPYFGKRRVHPPLIGRSCFSSILDFDGEYGLRGALSPFAFRQVPISDEGATMDADTPEDYQRLRTYVKAHFGISEKRAETYFTDYDVPEEAAERARQVAAVATTMAVSMIRAGQPLDLSLVVGAAMLQALNMVDNKKHDGAKLLRSRGYTALAKIVARQGRRPSTEGQVLDESSLIFIADQVVQGDVEKVAEAILRYEEISHENLSKQCRDLLP